MGYVYEYTRICLHTSIGSLGSYKNSACFVNKGAKSDTERDISLKLCEVGLNLEYCLYIRTSADKLRIRRII